MIGVVVGTRAFRPEVMLLEIQKFPPDLDASKIEEVPDGLKIHIPQGTVEPNE
jgi:hypothetical protein